MKKLKVKNIESSKEHKKTIMQFESFEVDTKMVPIIKWLNSFPGITTEYCCEDNEGFAYVLFRCTDLMSLTDISKQAQLTVEPPNIAVPYVRFEFSIDVTERDSFVKFIKQKFPETQKVSNKKLKYG